MSVDVDVDSSVFVVTSVEALVLSVGALVVDASVVEVVVSVTASVVEMSVALVVDCSVETSTSVTSVTTSGSSMVVRVVSSVLASEEA